MFIPFAHFQTSTATLTPGLTALDYGRFAAVKQIGTTSSVMWSNDGITWTLASAFSGSWTAIDFSPEQGLFCAVSESPLSNNIMTSTNSVTWTRQTKPGNSPLRSINWCSTWNKWLAVSHPSGTYSGFVFESPDAITWTEAFKHGVTPSQLSYKGTFITFSGPNRNQSEYAIPIPLSTTENGVIYSNDGINFKTYSISNFTMSSATNDRISSIVPTIENGQLAFFAITYNGVSYGSTGSLNATGSTTWSKITTSGYSVSDGVRNLGTSINPDVATRSTVVRPHAYLSSNTVLSRYSNNITPTYAGDWPVAASSSVIWRFRDVHYAKALSRWVMVSAQAASGANLIFTADLPPDGNVTNWTLRTPSSSAFGANFAITFGEGVRTTGYRVGAGIT